MKKIQFRFLLFISNSNGKSNGSFCFPSGEIEKKKYKHTQTTGMAFLTKCRGCSHSTNALIQEYDSTKLHQLSLFLP